MTGTESTLSYGVPRKPTSSGVYGMNAFASGLAFIAAVVAIPVLVFVGPITGIVYLVIAAGVVGLISLKDRHGKSIADHAVDHLAFNRAVKSGSTVFQPGALTYHGDNRLPGVLASSTLSEGEDDAGHRYAMITYPATGHHVVDLKANPDGASLIDDATAEQRVTRFGDWLARLAYEPGLVQAEISIEIAADMLPGLELEINSNLKDDAPDLAKLLFQQMLETYPEGGSTSSATVSLTFTTPSGLDKKARKGGGVEAMRERLNPRLSQLLSKLPTTGAGPVSLMTADDVKETVRCAFNPGDRVYYQRLRAAGQVRPVTTWGSAGPTATKEERGYYIHSDGVSVTWEKTGFTSSKVKARAMAPLLEQHPSVPVLRVTWIYQPVSPAAAGTIAERDHNNADHKRLSSKKPSARVLRDVAQADAVRDAEANGASLLNMAILVSATVRSVADLPAAEAALDEMGPSARLHLRRMDGAQAANFAQAIGVLGLVAGAHSTVPTSVRSGL